MKFAELGLAETILRAVSQEGYEVATPIQIQAIPPVIKGRDLMGCAQTGTGKTAAFALPTLHRLSQDRPQGPDQLEQLGFGAVARTVDERRSAPSNASGVDRDVRGTRFEQRSSQRPGQRGPQRPGAERHLAPAKKIRALILSPTRELAAQIGESFRAYGRFTGLKHVTIFGGVSQVPQVRDLRFGVDIMIATPGRLLDLMDQGYIDLSAVEILILDEADQMLDMGFIVPLRKIVSAVPRRRQTLMFSATMPPEIRQLAVEWLRDPVNIQVAPVATPAEKVKQSVFFVEPKQKPYLLSQFLKGAAHSRTLVFTRTKHGADRVVKHLNRDGIRAEAIHGNKSQGARQRVLAQFKSEQPPVLVATDIAARGLDIDAISHVINFDMPDVPETYVHRIGRTARAGAEGVAIAFCSQEERYNLRLIERLIRRTIPVERMPGEAGGREFSTTTTSTSAPVETSGYRSEAVASERTSGERNETSDAVKTPRVHPLWADKQPQGSGNRAPVGGPKPRRRFGRRGGQRTAGAASRSGSSRGSGHGGGASGARSGHAASGTSAGGFGKRRDFRDRSRS